MADHHIHIQWRNHITVHAHSHRESYHRTCTSTQQKAYHSILAHLHRNPHYYKYFWFKYDLGQKYYAPQVKPDQHSNSWPPDYDSVFHVMEMNDVTTWRSVTYDLTTFTEETISHYIYTHKGNYITIYAHLQRNPYHTMCTLTEETILCDMHTQRGNHFTLYAHSERKPCHTICTLTEETILHYMHTQRRNHIPLYAHSQRKPYRNSHITYHNITIAQSIRKSYSNTCTFDRETISLYTHTHSQKETISFTSHKKP